MDDPDVDHDLIAFMRETLTLSNKAQDTISSDTGKAISLVFLFLCMFNAANRVSRFLLDMKSDMRI